MKNSVKADITPEQSTFWGLLQLTNMIRDTDRLGVCWGPSAENSTATAPETVNFLCAAAVRSANPAIAMMSAKVVPKSLLRLVKIAIHRHLRGA